MAAVIITLPAATLISTMLAASAAVTLRPAAFAIFCGKLEVSTKSSTLPLAVKVSTTVTAEGGGDGGDGGDGGGGVGGGGDGEGGGGDGGDGGGEGGGTGGDGGREGGGGGGAVSLPPPQAQHKPTLFSRPLTQLCWGLGSADCHL